jgi:2'-5' RNA ligase
MNGIASLLDTPATERVKRLWQELEVRCGLTGVKITPFPHFSWQVAEGYDIPALETVLQEIVRETKPFRVRTTGLGLFTGDSPIIYIPLVKDRELLEFHARLWDATRSSVISAHPYYSPEAWVPHITLAYGDVNADNLGCAMHFLAAQSFDWEIQVDNLVFIAQSEGATVEACRYHFGEESGSRL